MTTLAKYIPEKLNISESKGLSSFPVDIEFADHKDNEKEKIISRSLYEPDLNSFVIDEYDDVMAMKYNNIYDYKWWMEIAVGIKDKYYHAIKYDNNNKKTMFIHGYDWNEFFATVIMCGLENGEPCKVSSFSKDK